MRKKMITSLLLVGAMLTSSLPVFAENDSHIIPYKGNYDEAAFPQNTMDTTFTPEPLVVDGIMDEAYALCAPSAIDNQKNKLAGEDAAIAVGTLYSAWNGSILYVLVEVDDTTLQTTETVEEALGSNPAIPTVTDSVSIGIDLYHDEVAYETDTIGTFNIDANGTLHYYRNGMIPSLGSVIGDPIHPEYQNRISGYAASLRTDEAGNAIGYTVEAAIQIEELGIENGKIFGFEVQINDAASMEQVPQAETEVAAEGQELPQIRLVGNTFWSHEQDGLYNTINDSTPFSVDWGNLVLTGWNETDAFVYSDWRLTDAIRYLDSISFPKDVYTDESQKVLDDARTAAEAYLAGEIKDFTQVNELADALDNAIAGLRWRDTKYPDPDELTDVMTLPNPYQFFMSDRIVESLEDWEERRAEILDLAQFYEYGYKPDAPESIEVVSIEHFNVGDKRTILFWGFWEMEVDVTCPTDIVTLTITDNGKTANMDFTIFLPTEEQLANAGRTGSKVPVVLSFDGDNESYRNAGLAVVQLPAGSSGDTRTNEYAWGERTGTFYELYPYSRNGEGALNEVSSEMAAAWAATRDIDVLETISDCELEFAADIAAAIDPEMLAVTGFSINGKYAFVSAVFDERIDVCIPGAAGASGPSPWRYVYTGHEYDWTGTMFAPAEGAVSSPLQVASGTEMMANSIRHNRVRETELFRQFLTPGNFYKRLEGAYGYGTRLPYDQNDLIATLAPRAIILVNTVNDYNDGCEADSLGLQAAKAVYETLGYDADNLVKFNQRGVQDGEPHGTDTVQYERNAEYLNYYFFGDEMAEETASWLNTDPFSLLICNGQTQTPYDYYYGGFNTITGGTGGVEGTDGWYFYRFPEAE